MTLRIAVPDGPLRAPSLELLAAAEVVEAAAPVAGAAAGADARSGRGPAAQVTALAAADVPLYLSLGAADVGLVAKDVLLERATGLCELLDLRFGRAVLVYAAAPGANARAQRLGHLRIATRHPTLTRAHFAARGVAVSVLEVAGPLERAIADGLADGVVALVDAPDGLAQPVVSGLTVEAVVATSSVRLVCGRGARVLHTAALGALVARLRDLTAGKEPT
jgi:ATP phosphoribosyltransferase